MQNENKSPQPAQLICGFVFAYAKIRFSQNEAHIFFFAQYRLPLSIAYFLSPPTKL